MKDKILELRKLGKTYSEISLELGCSKGTISYHCGKGQKEKAKLRVRKHRKKNPLITKVKSFRSKCRDFQNHRGLRKIDKVNFTFGIKEVEHFIGDNPICYLSGRPINVEDSKSFHFDHIHPVSKGGLSTLDNLGLTVKEANQAKSDLTVDEFLLLCKDVLEFNGFKVNKI